MKQVEIKAEMWKRGIKQAEIARELEVSESLVSRILSGQRRNDDVLKYIRSRIRKRQAA